MLLRLCIGALCVCNLALVFGFRDMRSLDHQLSAACSFVGLFLILKRSMPCEQSKTGKLPGSSNESVSEQIMLKHLQMLNWGILLTKARASYQVKKNTLLESKMGKIIRRNSCSSSSSGGGGGNPPPDKILRNLRGKSPPPRAYEMRKWKSWGDEGVIIIPDFHSSECRNSTRLPL